MFNQSVPNYEKQIPDDVKKLILSNLKIAELNGYRLSSKTNYAFVNKLRLEKLLDLIAVDSRTILFKDQIREAHQNKKNMSVISEKEMKELALKGVDMNEKQYKAFQSKSILDGFEIINVVKLYGLQKYHALWRDGYEVSPLTNDDAYSIRIILMHPDVFEIEWKEKMDYRIGLLLSGAVMNKSSQVFKTMFKMGVPLLEIMNKQIAYFNNEVWKNVVGGPGYLAVQFIELAISINNPLLAFEVLAWIGGNKEKFAALEYHYVMPFAVNTDEEMDKKIQPLMDIISFKNSSGKINTFTVESLLKNFANKAFEKMTSDPLKKVISKLLDELVQVTEMNFANDKMTYLISDWLEAKPDWYFKVGNADSVTYDKAWYLLRDKIDNQLLALGDDQYLNYLEHRLLNLMPEKMPSNRLIGLFSGKNKSGNTVKEIIQLMRDKNYQQAEKVAEMLMKTESTLGNQVYKVAKEALIKLNEKKNPKPTI